MYAVYNYAVGATQADILSDVVAILTGTTSVASLSSSCVKANSSITSTVPAGWTLYDSAAGTNAQVIRAINVDGSTYGYATISTNSTTVLGVSSPESWNASTHVATNNTPQTGTSYDLTSGGFLYIYSSVRGFWILGWTPAGYSTVVGVAEFSRDTIPAGYPCKGGCSSERSSGTLSRMKNQTSTGDSLSIFVGQYPVSTGSTTPPSIYRDAAENQYFILYSYASSYAGLWLGVYYEVKATGTTSVNALDELNYGGTTYVVFKTGVNTGTSSVILVPKQ